MITDPPTHKHRQDRLQYTVLQLARSVITFYVLTTGTAADTATANSMTDTISRFWFEDYSGLGQGPRLRRSLKDSSLWNDGVRFYMSGATLGTQSTVYNH